MNSRSRSSLNQPIKGVSYIQVLRADPYDPAKSIFGVILGLSAFMVFVPLIGQLLIFCFWLVFAGQKSRSEYFTWAASYQIPEGIVAAHLALATLILISLALYRYLHKMEFRWLASVQPGMRWRYLIICLLLAAIVLNSINLLSLVGSDLPVVEAQNNWLTFLLVVLMFSPLQAAAEEVFFRGYLLQGIGSLSANNWMPIVFSALLFAVFHGVQSPALFADRFLFGLLAGFLVALTGGLEASIAAHIVNNLSAFGYAIFTGGIAELKAIEKLSWSAAIWDVLGYASFALLAILLAKKMNLAKVTGGPTSS